MSPDSGVTHVPGPYRSGFSQHEALPSDLSTSDAHEDGWFAFPCVPKGRYRIDVDADGWSRACVYDVEVPANGISNIGIVALSQGESIEGQIRAIDSDGVSGAQLVAVAEGAWTKYQQSNVVYRGRSTATTKADENGLFELRGLARGPYVLYARAPGYIWTRLNQVSSGDTGVLLRLGRGGQYILRVVDAESGAAIRGAQVDVALPEEWSYRVDRAPQVQVETWDSAIDGYRVSGIGSERTVLQVSAPGYARDVVETDGLSEGAAASLTCALWRETTLQGTVLDRNRHPLGGAMVQLAANNDGSVGLFPTAVSTREDGTYSIGGLRSGKWIADVSKSGFYSTRTNDLVLFAGANTLDPIMLDRGAGLRARVVDLASGLSVEGAFVAGSIVHLGEGGISRGRSGARTSFEAVSDARGEFSVDGLATGEYRITVSHRSASVARSLGDQQVTNGILVASPEQAKEAGAGDESTVAALQQVVVQGPGTLEVRVGGEEDVGVSERLSAQVQLSSGGARVGDPSFLMGEARLWTASDLDPGEYALTVRMGPESLTREWPLAIRSGEVTRFIVEVDTGTIMGEVRESGLGLPALGCRVLCRYYGNSDGENAKHAASAIGRVVGGAVAESNAAGVFVVPFLSPGRYRLEAGGGEWVNDGYCDVELGGIEGDNVAVVGGVQLHVQRAARIEGIVRYALGGHPATGLNVQFYSVDRGGTIAEHALSDGSFASPPLLPGTYQVIVIDPDESNAVLVREERYVKIGQVARVELEVGW